MIFIVYAFKAGTTVVYVGMTGRPLHARVTEHHRMSAWWNPTLEVEELSFHCDEFTAAKAERKAIATHRPMFNVSSNPDYSVRRAA